MMGLQSDTAVHGRVAARFTPIAPYFRAVRSFLVPPNGSNRCVIRTPVKPADSNARAISASGRAPAIQPVHKSMSRLIDSDSSFATTMSA
jgi:hypothetical protein